MRNKNFGASSPRLSGARMRSARRDLPFKATSIRQSSLFVLGTRHAPLCRTYNTRTCDPPASLEGVLFCGSSPTPWCGARLAQAPMRSIGLLTGFLTTTRTKPPLCACGTLLPTAPQPGLTCTKISDPRHGSILGHGCLPLVEIYLLEPTRSCSAAFS